MATQSTALRNAHANAFTTLVDAGVAAGTLKVYSGTAPAGPNTTATGTLLVSFTLVDPSAAAAVVGVATIDADPDLTATAAATGTAGYGRFADSAGLGVLDVSVGTSGAELILSSLSLVSGGTVTVTTGTVTSPAS